MSWGWRNDVNVIIVTVNVWPNTRSCSRRERIFLQICMKNVNPLYCTYEGRPEGMSVPVEKLILTIITQPVRKAPQFDIDGSQSASPPNQTGMPVNRRRGSGIYKTCSSSLCGGAWRLFKRRIAVSA